MKSFSKAGADWGLEPRPSISPGLQMPHWGGGHLREVPHSAKRRSDPGMVGGIEKMEGR